MKKTVLLMFLAVLPLLVGCVSNESRQQQLQKVENLKNMVPCPRSRPIACGSEDKPACGIFPDGSTWDYSSGCIACTRHSIVGYIESICAAIPQASVQEN